MLKKFFKEFKEFITRGNVLDMAVGVIVGGAFTAIITALTSQILQPLINWLLAGTGAGLESAVTMLKPAYDEKGVLDLSASIYINWGAFITAVINFILVALILFCIVKTINTVRAGGRKVAEKQKAAIDKKLKKGQLTEEEAEKAKAEVEAAAEPVAPVETTDDLLREIRDLLKANAAAGLKAAEKLEDKTNE
ncbi:MAG: large conductance mechanosensitive channel protein MscL [Clostridia bacterium]|nr:large conductance mechanosensitive channel protein MscL [Clostridia bacterium]